MTTDVLEERSSASQSNSFGQNRFANKSDSKDSSGPVCYNFNAGKECRYSPFKFHHVCELCGQTHAKINHETLIKSSFVGQSKSVSQDKTNKASDSVPCSSKVSGFGSPYEGIFLSSNSI